MKPMTAMRRFLVSEEGPTAVEYAIMLSLIIMVCWAAISSIGAKTTGPYNKMANSLGS